MDFSPEEELTEHKFKFREYKLVPDFHIFSSPRSVYPFTHSPSFSELSWPMLLKQSSLIVSHD